MAGRPRRLRQGQVHAPPGRAPLSWSFCRVVIRYVAAPPGSAACVLDPASYLRPD